MNHILKSSYIVLLGAVFLTQYSCNNATKSNASESSDSTLLSEEIAIVKPEKPVPVFNNFIPNELGKVMVLEYHLIGEPEDRWRRTPENLRKDFQTLYEQGFYPISVLDLANGNIDVPAGKTPFAITYDDSSAGQFRFIEKNGKLEIDPDCAVGIMEEFKRFSTDSNFLCFTCY
jgi:hypothetical protein